MFISRAFPGRITGAVRAAWQSLRAGVQARAERASAAIDAAMESELAGRLAGSPRRSLMTSLTVHSIVILSALIVWPHHFFGDGSTIPSVIPVDLVSIADDTNIAPMVREKLSLPEADVQTPPPPPPALDQAEMAPVFEMKLFPQKPQPAAQPKRSDAALDGTNTHLVADLKPSSGPKNARLGDQDIKGIGDETAMTMTLTDALRNQIARCWNVPIGTSKAAQPIVSFELFLNPDGSVARPPRLAENSASVTGSDTYLLAMAEAVRRAIYTCAPYRMPVNRYGQWRDITLAFDPRMTMGDDPPP